jgi:hypothetical protein
MENENANQDDGNKMVNVVVVQNTETGEITNVIVGDAGPDAQEGYTDLSGGKVPSPEWASKGPYKVHQQANARGVMGGKVFMNSKEGTLAKLKIASMNAGTEYADREQFQTGANSYRHAMRNGDVNQSMDEAKSQADAFVRKQFEIAKKLLNEGKIAEAYYQFGVGLHTLQDATSPAHAGFQPWGDHPSNPQLLNHIKQELFYPGQYSNLQNITNLYLNWFENGNAPLPRENLFNNIKHD